jgi:(1->4)-alpha-D-glucan 1-alpha-D-glucosylmutase
MLKALREAKLHTSWINPNAEYDEAICEFIGRILDESANGAFLDDFRAFTRRVAAYGLYNSLSQALLKFAAPGVPDTYQGTELWDFSLVDPDNRRPVDYRERHRMLQSLRSAIESAGGDLREPARDLIASKEDGRIKLYVTHRSLALRRDHPGLFTAGEYIPLAAEGAKAAHLFAFARRSGEAAAVVAVPRLIVRLNPDPARPPLGPQTWSDTRLPLTGLDPALRWRNAFTGEVLVSEDRDGPPSLAAADLFAHFPVALLVAEHGG